MPEDLERYADGLGLIKGTPEYIEFMDLGGRALMPEATRCALDPILLAAKAHSTMLEHWLAEERGDTGPWRIGFNGKLLESPRARELRELRELRQQSRDMAGLDELRRQLEAVTAERDGIRRELDTLRAQLAALSLQRGLSEAEQRAPTRHDPEQMALPMSVEADISAAEDMLARTPATPQREQRPAPRRPHR